MDDSRDDKVRDPAVADGPLLAIIAPVIDVADDGTFENPNGIGKIDTVLGDVGRVLGLISLEFGHRPHKIYCIYNCSYSQASWFLLWYRDTSLVPKP